MSFQWELVELCPKFWLIIRGSSSSGGAEPSEYQPMNSVSSGGETTQVGELTVFKLLCWTLP